MISDNCHLVTTKGHGPVRRMPPSTGKIAAVTIEASSEARYSAA
jgi:hypothetical protein